MTEEERERERLRYIQASITRIEEYTHAGQDVFFREPIVQDAVLRRLETLADATGKLSDALKERHPEIPWRRGSTASVTLPRTPMRISIFGGSGRSWRTTYPLSGPPSARSWRTARTKTSSDLEWMEP